MRRGKFLVLPLCMSILFTACYHKSDKAGMEKTSIPVNAPIDSSLSKKSINDNDSTKDSKSENSSKAVDTGQHSSILKKDDVEINKEEKFSGCVFNFNQNIYVYNEDAGEIRIMGTASQQKHYMTLSPDKSKVAFVYANEAPEKPKIGIHNLFSGDTRDILIENRYASQINTIFWADNDRIIASGHVNPSVTGFVLYDAVSGKELNFCGGSFYQILNDKKTMMFKLTPHVFPPAPDNITLMVRDGDEGDIREVYQTKDPGDIIYHAGTTGKNENILFIAYTKKSKSLDLNLGKLDTKKTRLTLLESLQILKGVNAKKSDQDDGADFKSNICNLIVSKDFSKIVVLINNDKKSKAHIEVFDININQWKVSKKTIIPMDSNLNGYLSFESENHILLNSSEGIYRILEGKLSKIESDNPLKRKIVDDKRVNRFRDALIKHLGVDGEDFDVNNFIFWF